MSEEQLNASLDAEGAKPLEDAEGAAADVELTDEELAGVAGGNQPGGAYGALNVPSYKPN